MSTPSTLTGALCVIVAIDSAGGIGINNTLPWRLPEDLAHFKRTTSGHPIIMGRKTFDSIGRPLPNRRNIVVTRNHAWSHPGVESVSSLEQAAQIYQQALPLAQRLIVTEIARRFDCDAFFPAIDGQQWQAVARESHHDASQNLDYAFVTYERR